MAKLTANLVLDLIKNPLNRTYIDQAIFQQERLQFHCEPFQQKDQLPNRAYRDYISWVGSFLPADKLKRFESLLRTPLDTVVSTETIFNELSKVFEADDRYIKFDFVSEEIEADANDYAARIGDADFWRTDGFDALKTGINSIIVVDLPSVQITSRPEPYYYLVDISKVLDIDFFKDGVLSYIIYHYKDYLIYIDEQSYMIATKKTDGDEWQIDEANVFTHTVYTENGGVVEGLGYAPARSFWQNSIKNTKHINKKGALTNVLSKLDWLLFWRVSKKYFDLYGAWPMMVSYKRNCTYRDEHNNECNSGYINYNTTNGISMQKICPACSASSSLGPGTKYEVDPPKDKDDVDLLLNPIKFIEVTTDKLDYTTLEQERLENELYLDVVGYDGDSMNKQAVNDDQVAANFVSKEAVLDTIKVEVQGAHKWAIDTSFKQRYGNYFIGSTVDYGTNYFLKTPEELGDQYDNYKKAGLPSYIVADVRDKLNRTENKNNPDRLSRNQILEQLEPYLDYSVDQLKNMGIHLSDHEGFQIKLNFNTFIQRFEREQMNIVQFGSKIDFNNKINTIHKKLKEYANEKKPIAQPDTPAA